MQLTADAQHCRPCEVTSAIAFTSFKLVGEMSVDLRNLYHTVNEESSELELAELRLHQMLTPGCTPTYRFRSSHHTSYKWSSQSNLDELCLTLYIIIIVSHTSKLPPTTEPSPERSRAMQVAYLRTQSGGGILVTAVTINDTGKLCHSIERTKGSRKLYDTLCMKSAS